MENVEDKKETVEEEKGTQGFRKTAIDILLGIVLIATFIATFFFTFVSKVEGQVVKEQMEKIVRDLTHTIKLYTSNSGGGEQLSNLVANLQIPNLQKQDDAVAEHNKQIKKKAGIIFGIIILVGLIIIVSQARYIKSELGIIILANIVVLGLVALTEYLFVSNVSKNYQIIDGNYVRYLLLKDIKEYGKNG